MFLALLVCTGLLAACAPAAEESGGPQDRTAAGGVSLAAENINLKDINITQERGQTVVTLSLLSGSRKTGYAESKLTQLPEYQITLLRQPQRLMIRLSNISFWDYEQKDSWALSDFAVGVFREVPAADGSLVVYVQLTRDAAFTTEEQEGNLIVRLTPGAENEGRKYFCVLNAFLEHQEGRWPGGVDMEPVLCSDLQSRLLISKPFDTRDEAEGFMTSAMGALAGTLPDKPLSVIGLDGGELPGYPTDADYSLLEGRQILQKNGVPLETALLLQNGRFLAAAPDGRIAFSRSYKTERPTLMQDRYLLSERLWIRDPNGRIQNLDIPEFFSIGKAAFSADGNYIALLDESMENRVLYVYAFESGTLYNLGEEGFGSQTAAFAWSDVNDTLYAATGSGAMWCVFSADGGTRIGAFGETARAEGHLAVSRDRLFFADRAQGFVFLVGENHRQITKGADLRADVDGKTLLVLEPSSTGDEQVLTSLKLCDIETGDEVYIAEDEEIFDFEFLPGGSKVCFTAASNENADFPYALFVFDTVSGVADRVALVSTARFAPAPASASLYFTEYVDNGGGDSFFATYAYDLNA